MRERIERSSAKTTRGKTRRCDALQEGLPFLATVWHWGSSVLAAFVFLVLGSTPLAAREMNCAVFDELATLVHLSELFLDNVETGANPRAQKKLEKFLRETPIVQLRMQLNENGMNILSTPTASFYAKQQTLLKIRKLGGQFKAAETARKLRLREKLNTYREELVATPCLGKSQRVRGTKGSNAAGAEHLVSTEVASVGAISVLILGVIAFIIYDRISKINSRKKKRYLCNADCIVLYQDDEERDPFDAQIVDVSQIGAKVKSEVVCNVGEEIEVTFPDKKLVFPTHTITYDGWSIPGTVLWKNGNYFGVEFEKLMPMDSLKQLTSPV